MVLTGAEVPAREALEMGLVSRVVPRGDLESTVTGLARALAGLSPATLAVGKEAFYTALEMEHGQALGYLRDLLTIVVRSDDAREGIAAFLDKRPPRWTGR
jgi:enoyl-CoA hydratase/carnithine racemase